MTDPANLIDRQRQLANFLVAGWPALEIPPISHSGAIAAVGNATQENQCKSVTVGDKDHGSDGLFQWRLDRLTNLQTFGQKWFGTWQSIEAQAAFFSFECKGDYPTLWTDLVAGAKPVPTLVANICDEYERPSAAGRVLDQRISYATTFATQWGTALPAPLPAAPAPAPAAPSGVVPPVVAPVPVAPSGAGASPFTRAQAIGLIASLADWLVRNPNAP